MNISVEQFINQNQNKHLSTFKQQLSTMTVRDILFLEQCLIITKNNSKLQEHQYEIDEKLLELRKRKNKNYNPEKIVKDLLLNSKIKNLILNLILYHLKFS